MSLFSWLRPSSKDPLPALAPGRGWTFDIVGEGAYQPALSRLCGGRRESGHRKDCEAVLVFDDANRHDPNAVRVEVRGRVVGYLSRAHALEYRTAITKKRARCAARIVGGWDYGDGDQGSFGVKLKLSWPPRLL